MGSSYTASGYFEIGGRTPSQGNRIWIFHTQISGWKVDSGGIGQLLDAEIRFFEGNVRANQHCEKPNSDSLGLFLQLGCQENSKCNSPELWGQAHRT